VDEGLITDDMVEEKRQLAAIMLRRLEVEEWDKERMRHFYYGERRGRGAGLVACAGGGGLCGQAGVLGGRGGALQQA
jgi:hypothetical protein